MKAAYKTLLPSFMVILSLQIVAMDKPLLKNETESTTTKVPKNYFYVINATEEFIMYTVSALTSKNQRKSFIEYSQMDAHEKAKRKSLTEYGEINAYETCKVNPIFIWDKKLNHDQLLFECQASYGKFGSLTCLLGGMYVVYNRDDHQLAMKPINQADDDSF